MQYCFQDLTRACRRFLTSSTKFAVPVALALYMGNASAGSLQVSNLADAGPGSLRAAIALADPGQTIEFAPNLSGTIVLTQQLTVTRALTLQGRAGIVIDGADTTRLFRLGAVPVVIRDLTLQRGFATDGGGAIYSDAQLRLERVRLLDNHSGFRGGALFVWNDGLSSYQLVDVEFLGNSAETGGAIWDNGAASSSIRNARIIDNFAETSGGGIMHLSGEGLAIVESVIGGNVLTGGATATGGGVFSQDGALEITRSTISGNRAGDAGGLYVVGSPTTTSLLLEESLIVGNTATEDAGGIFVAGVEANIVNSTIAQNVAVAGSAGGVWVREGVGNPRTTHVIHSTIVGNSAGTRGGGIDNSFGSLRLQHSIVSQNESPVGPDVRGTLLSDGFNLVRNQSGSSGYVASDLPSGLFPLVGPLALNGGPTRTMLPQASSPVIDAVPGPLCRSFTVDQRGFFRAGACDIGAADSGATQVPEVVFFDDFEDT